MNSASTAKPHTGTNFQYYYESQNAYPFSGPEELKGTKAVRISVLSCPAMAEMDASFFTDLSNRTAAPHGELERGSLYGHISPVGLSESIDIFSPFPLSLRFTGDTSGVDLEPGVFAIVVPSGDNTTFTAPTPSAPFQRDLAELRALVLGISEGITLPRSAEFDRLLDRALAKKGKPRDVDDWARRLAKNVANLDD